MSIAGAGFPQRPAVAPSLDRPGKPNALVRRGTLGVLGAVVGLTLATLLPRPALAQEIPNCNDLGQVLTPLAICMAPREIEGDRYQWTEWGYRNDASEACTVPMGDDNWFSPGAPFRGQTEIFQPGTVKPAFPTEHLVLLCHKRAWHLGSWLKAAGTSG